MKPLSWAASGEEVYMKGPPPGVVMVRIELERTSCDFRQVGVRSFFDIFHAQDYCVFALDGDRDWCAARHCRRLLRIDSTGVDG